MKLCELFDLTGMERNVERLKKNAKRQADIAKAAKARLNMLKARQQMFAVSRNGYRESLLSRQRHSLRDEEARGETRGSRQGVQGKACRCHRQPSRDNGRRPRNGHCSSSRLSDSAIHQDRKRQANRHITPLSERLRLSQISSPASPLDRRER